MTTVTTYTTQNGDIVELRTNPGTMPAVYLNGIRQNPGTYRISGKSVLFNENYDWQPHKLWLPKRINGHWYWLGDTVYRRWTTSPGGGFWIYGDDFDMLKAI